MSNMYAENYIKENFVEEEKSFIHIIALLIYQFSNQFLHKKAARSLL